MREQMTRRVAAETLARARAAASAAQDLRDFLDDWHRNRDLPATELPEALMDYYAGATNGFLSELIEAVTGRRVEIVGEVAELLACPCCGYLTLDERYDPALGTGWDICPFCHWEDDGTTDPEAGSGCNHGSMNAYRLRIEAEPNFYVRSRWRR